MSLSNRENEKASAVWRVLRGTHTQKYIILSLCGCFYFKRARWQKRNSSLSLPFFSFCGMKRTCTSDSATAGLKQKVSAALLFNVSALPLFIIWRQVLLHSNNYDCPLCERLLKWSVSPFSRGKCKNVPRTTGALFISTSSAYPCGFCVSCNIFHRDCLFPCTPFFSIKRAHGIPGAFHLRAAVRHFCVCALGLKLMLSAAFFNISLPTAAAAAAGSQRRWFRCQMREKPFLIQSLIISLSSAQMKNCTTHCLRLVFISRTVCTHHQNEIYVFKQKNQLLILRFRRDYCNT